MTYWTGYWYHAWVWNVRLNNNNNFSPPRCLGSMCEQFVNIFCLKAADQPLITGTSKSNDSSAETELPNITIKYLEYTVDIVMITYFSKLLELIAQLAVQQIVTTYFSWSSSKEDNITQLPPSYNSKMGDESWRHADCHFLFFWFLSATPYSVMRYQQEHRYRGQTHSATFILAVVLAQILCYHWGA